MLDGEGRLGDRVSLGKVDKKLRPRDVGNLDSLWLRPMSLAVLSPLKFWWRPQYEADMIEMIRCFQEAQSKPDW